MMKWSICIVVIAGLYSFANAQDIPLSFHQLSRADGLSNDTNSYVYKDSRGFVWISSLDGLNRFDGQSVKVYRPDVNSTNSIDGNIVSSHFYEDEHANIWFTTYGSVNCYVRAHDHFVSYKLKNEADVELTEDYRAFHLDDTNGLWVRTGLRDGGLLHRFDITTAVDRIIGPIHGKRNFYLNDPSNNTSHVISTILGEHAGVEISELDGQQILNVNAFFRDGVDLPKIALYNTFAKSLNEIYFGSIDGLVTFSAITGIHKIHKTFNGQQVGRVWSMTELNGGQLLVSSQYLGLLVFDKSSAAFISNYAMDEQDPYSIGANTIFEVFIDRSDNIWVSIWGKGLNYASLGKRRFELIQPKTETPVNTSSITIGPDRRIWVADRSGDVTVFNKDKSIWKNTNPLRQLNFGNQFTLEHIRFDSDGGLWAVVRNLIKESAELIYMNKNSNTWKKAVATSKDITSIFELPGGRILATTRSGILELLNKTTLVPCPEFDDYQALPFYNMFLDDHNQLYLSANFDRILVYKLTANGKLQYVKSINEVGYANAYYQEPKDSLIWVASSSGLLKISRSNLSTTLLTEDKDDMPVESLFSIAGGGDQDLWIKSQSDFLKYNYTTRDLKKYNAIDGVQKVFENRAHQVIDDDGFIWLSGVRGITYFHPDSIQDLSIQAQPQLTDIMISGEDIQLDTCIGEAQQIFLKYDENTISLRFVANAFGDPSRTRFRYRLMDYDPVWVSGETQGLARFVNVPWGDYVFELQATNSEDRWSQTQTLNICITPPWWATWWAYLLYLLAAYGILKFYISYRSRLLVQQNLKLEETVNLRTSELAKSLSDLKTTQAQLIHSEKMASLGQVTAGVAHEIQNPLNFVNNFSDVSNDLIAEMVEEMEKGDMEEAKAIATDVQENLNRISHHGKRADSIVRSMLEHSRSSSGKVALSDINGLITENLRRTYSLTKNKERYFDTVIETNLDESIDRINIVAQDIGRVIFNVLKNALYASNEKKKTAGPDFKPTIRISTDQSDHWVSIFIEDNGVGIPEDVRSQVFQPFFTTKPTGEGTGLGLSLSYDIMRAHGGELKLKSTEGEGSTFIIQLPIKK